MHKPRHDLWSKEVDEKLMQLWNIEGRSASEIAAAFSKSRNAVVGRVARLRASGVKMRMGEGGVSRIYVAPIKTAPKPKPSVVSFWSRDRVRRLCEYWNEGMTAKAIGEILGASIGAIGNKIYDLRKAGLDLRLGNPGSIYVPRGNVHVVHPAAPAPVIGRGKSIMELGANQCRFPTGGRAPEWLFCGNETAPGESWCVHCRKIVYQPAQQARAA